MGSCSSGGPNKLSDMCLPKKDGISNEEDVSRVSSRQAFVSSSDYRKRPDQIPSDYLSSSVKEKGSTMQPDRVPFETSDDDTSAKSRHRGYSLNDARRRGDFQSAASEGGCGDGSLCVANRQTSSGAGILPGDGHSSSTSAMGCTGIRESGATMATVSSSIPSNSTDVNVEVASRRPHHRHRYLGRKASAHCWAGVEIDVYSNCIVPPPNKTVFDAYRSPNGQSSDWSPETSWPLDHWNDQKVSSIDKHHQKDAAVNNNSSSCGLLASGGLSSASISSSASCSSSSADSSLARRRGSGAKRSSSVSSCPSSTAELLPTTRDDNEKATSEKERRHTSASENRPSGATQWIRNMLRPMEPLYGANVGGGSAKKYAPLNSDASNRGGTMDSTTTTRPAAPDHNKGSRST